MDSAGDHFTNRRIVMAIAIPIAFATALSAAAIRALDLGQAGFLFFILLGWSFAWLASSLWLLLSRSLRRTSAITLSLTLVATLVLVSDHA